MNSQTTTFYIVRHGQTEYNQNLIIQGHADSPLTELGEEQARNLAKKLKGVKFDAVFSSDLVRAKRTAEIIAKERQLEVIEKEIIRERTYGRLEGKSQSLLNKYDEIFASLTENEKFAYKMEPDVESHKEGAERFIRFIREISFAYQGKTILVVSHGSIMRALLIELGYSTYRNLKHLGNTAYFVLHSDGNDMKVVEMSDNTSTEE